MLFGIINGTDFVNNPWNITFSVYTNLLGASFYLVPIVFISAALYVHTRKAIAATSFILVTCLIFAGSNLFLNNPEMAFVFLIFASFGFVGTFLSIFFNKKITGG